mmetsp:Transcript_10769/g.16061  ORF Transcript_10769/g.16061 Transcript_10769/m.16061 type:complete len:303 (+) Transcript_10769:115-1023(+)
MIPDGIEKSNTAFEGETFTEKLKEEAFEMYKSETSSRLENSNENLSDQIENLDLKEEVKDKGTIAPSHFSESIMLKHQVWESYDGVFCNYFSLGVDAVAASAFHEHREAHPEQFTGRITNQIMYIRKGLPAAGGCFTASPPTLRNFVEIQVLKKGASEFEAVKFSKKLRGLIILNLQSYGGGHDLWGKMKSTTKSSNVFEDPKCDDGMLEIVGVTNIYNMGVILSMNKLGAHARKVAQAREIILKIRNDVHMQIDGEPWLQPASTVHLKHFGKTTCLVPKKHFHLFKKSELCGDGVGGSADK